VKRWYGRFEAIATGREHTMPSDNYVDEVYAFFMNCYHLKDWIKHDCAARVAAETVEQFVNSRAELRQCADICNSVKHLRLTRPTRTGTQPQVTGQEIKLGLGKQRRISIQLNIQTSDGEVNAFELATKCVHAWEEFIASRLEGAKS